MRSPQIALLISCSLCASCTPILHAIRVEQKPREELALSNVPDRIRNDHKDADDPSHEIFFADPRDGALHAAKARRVYNVNVVYRLRRGDGGAPWRRLRVVVSRKGIERIDKIC